MHASVRESFEMLGGRAGVPASGRSLLAGDHMAQGPERGVQS